MRTGARASQDRVQGQGRDRAVPRPRSAGSEKAFSRGRQGAVRKDTNSPEGARLLHEVSDFGEPLGPCRRRRLSSARRGVRGLLARRLLWTLDLNHLSQLDWLQGVGHGRGGRERAEEPAEVLPATGPEGRKGHRFRAWEADRDSGALQHVHRATALETRLAELGILGIVTLPTRKRFGGARPLSMVGASVSRAIREDRR
jgi:hypothetical protein